jgi:hypothetical protein
MGGSDVLLFRALTALRCEIYRLCCASGFPGKFQSTGVPCFDLGRGAFSLEVGSGMLGFVVHVLNVSD